MNIRTFGFVFEDGQKQMLDDERTVKDVLDTLVQQAGLTPLEYTCHRFSPQGLSATIILSESHIAVHTWPELGTGYIVMTSCASPGDSFTEQAGQLIAQRFGARLASAKELQ